MGAPEMTLDELEQILRLDGFREIPIHSGGQAARLIPRHRMRGQRDDGEMAPRQSFPAANDGGALEAIHHRHLDVHEHTAEAVGLGLVQHRERLPAVVRHQHRVPALLEQPPGDDLVDAIVLDEKNASGRLRVLRRAARCQRQSITLGGLRPQREPRVVKWKALPPRRTRSPPRCGRSLAPPDASR